MKSILYWAAFAICAPALVALALFLLYCFSQDVHSVIADPSWRMAAWAAAEVFVASWSAGAVLAWFARLPGAATLQRPISTFFVRG